MQLTDDEAFEKPRVYESNGKLFYSSIYTPDIEITDMIGGAVNGIFDLPAGWANMIENRLNELKDTFFYE